MPVPQDPAVAVYFTGLLIFCFDRRLGVCQIGIHSKTDDHELRIRFVKKGPGPGNESEQALTLSHGLIREVSNLWLDVEGGPSPKQQTAEPFITGGQSEPPTDPQDFRRVVDLERIYKRRLKVRKNVVRPILSVATGLFYSAVLTSDFYRTVPVASDGATWARATGRCLGQIAKYVGASIHLTHPDQALVLRAGRNGSELFSLRREEGATYEITVDNGDTSQAPAGGDFHYYFDAIRLKRSESRVFLEPYGLPSLGDRAFPPCGPVEFGMSDGFGFD